MMTHDKKAPERGPSTCWLDPIGVGDAHSYNVTGDLVEWVRKDLYDDLKAKVMALKCRDVDGDPHVVHCYDGHLCDVCKLKASLSP